jgi:hypothetical protein
MLLGDYVGAAAVLALVRGLLAEVHPHARPPAVTLDSPFEELGIGGLELAEVLLRVQDEFKVALPRRGYVAVFASPDPEGGAERLVVLAETSATEDEARSALRSEIAATTVDPLGVAPDDVVLAPPRTIPKTSSGKIRRAASRQIYEAGKVGARPRALWWELARLRLRGAAPSVRRVRRAAAAVAFAVHAWVL